MSGAAVYVPTLAGEQLLGIKKGSGIVGREVGDGRRVLIHYEGNLYGIPEYLTLANRCRAAYGRLSESYPTVAKALVHSSVLVKVGWFDGVEVKLYGPVTERWLAHWLGQDDARVDPRELFIQERRVRA
jgi:hypothetical protein